MSPVIPQALATGKLTLRMNALARQVLVDKDGLASGVSIIDRVTGKEEEIRARIIVLACASVESARLLLNSKSEKYPNGLANSNDLVGRYLTGHITFNTSGYLKDLVGKRPSRAMAQPITLIFPRFNHLRDVKKDYVGGWGVQLNFASWGTPHHAKSVAGFGSNYKQRVRALQPALFQAGAFGKVEARAENRVTVDPNKVDKHGIPIPIITFNWSENDLKLFKVMRASTLEVYDACGTELRLAGNDTPNGFASHEVGTCRMGNDPKRSVLNAYCQAHEVKNLFVVDGSSFTTFPEKNPTLTIAALAVRSARFMAEQKKKRNL
jgi:choline dehydrogenase-like flavoprotein